MGSSTVILILKSLLPLLKEFILKDKLLRETLLENKIATMLAGCVLFLFILVMHVSGLVTDAALTNGELKHENAYLKLGNDDLKARVGKMEEELRDLRRPPVTQPEPPPEETPPEPNPQPVKTKSKPKPKQQSLRETIQLRFKSFE